MVGTVKMLLWLWLSDYSCTNLDTVRIAQLSTLISHCPSPTSADQWLSSSSPSDLPDKKPDNAAHLTTHHYDLLDVHTYVLIDTYPYSLTIARGRGSAVRHAGFDRAEE